MENETQHIPENIQPTLDTTPNTTLPNQSIPETPSATANVMTLDTPRQPAKSLLKTNYIVILLLIFLVMTFFTPLGAAMYLPLYIVGIVFTLVVAFRAEVGKTKVAGPVSTGKALQGVAIGTAKVLAIIGAVISFGIIALIGLIFIFIQSGGLDNLDMGS